MGGDKETFVAEEDGAVLGTYYIYVLIALLWLVPDRRIEKRISSQTVTLPRMGGSRAPDAERMGSRSRLWVEHVLLGCEGIQAVPIAVVGKHCIGTGNAGRGAQWTPAHPHFLDRAR